MNEELRKSYEQQKEKYNGKPFEIEVLFPNSKNNFILYQERVSNVLNLNYYLECNNFNITIADYNILFDDWIDFHKIKRIKKYNSKYLRI